MEHAGDYKLLMDIRALISAGNRSTASDTLDKVRAMLGASSERPRKYSRKPKDADE